ncbi:hypothetical protein [Maricaulis sp.]|uniref:hypothetical protein n=1 Tax=Maricaulis sp. TaxID=1486257 RepID=UPI001B2E5E80|nr:hypothetical protein [Maricaulis sp.]MBO6797277.1 hypothetical protein [Maricaulis sp.]
MRAGFAIAAMVFGASSATAQGATCQIPPDLESTVNAGGEYWSRLIETVIVDEPSSLAVDNSGRIWVVGRGCEASGGARIVRLSQAGEILDDHGYGQGVIARWGRVSVAADGQVWTAGFYSDFYSQPRGPEGLFVYSFTEAEPEPDRGFHESMTYNGAEALLPLEGGGMFVVQSVGSARGAEQPTGQDVEIIRFSDSLNPVWTYRSHSPGDDMARSAALTPDGEIWVVGKKSTGNPRTGIRAWIGRFDREGNPLFERFFGTGSYSASFDAVLATEDGGAWMAGAVGGLAQTVLIRVDADGEVLHEVELDLSLPSRGTNPVALGLGMQRVTGLAATPEGGVFAVGHTSDPQSGELDALLVWISSDGELIRVETFGSSGSDHARAVYMLEDGSALVAGATTNGEPVMDRRGWYGWLFRVGPNGELPSLGSAG